MKAANRSYKILELTLIVRNSFRMYLPVLNRCRRGDPQRHRPGLFGVVGEMSAQNIPAIATVYQHPYP